MDMIISRRPNGIVAVRWGIVTIMALLIVCTGIVFVASRTPRSDLSMHFVEDISTNAFSKVLEPKFVVRLSNGHPGTVIFLNPSFQITWPGGSTTNWIAPMAIGNRSSSTTIISGHMVKAYTSREVLLRMPKGRYTWRAKARVQVSRPDWFLTLTRPLPPRLQRHLNFTWKDVEIPEHQR